VTDAAALRALDGPVFTSEAADVDATARAIAAWAVQGRALDGPRRDQGVGSANDPL
jgi:hypothetical protein